jgi:hypothetical protein
MPLPLVLNFARSARFFLVCGMNPYCGLAPIRIWNVSSLEMALLDLGSRLMSESMMERVELLVLDCS